MKCYQILFSPTGGTEKVAAAITQNWPEVQTIDLSSTSTDFASFFIESSSLVLVAMPSLVKEPHSWQLIVLLRSMEIVRSAFLWQYMGIAPMRVHLFKWRILQMPLAFR